MFRYILSGLGLEWRGDHRSRRDTRVARPSFNDSGFKNGQHLMVVWTKIINLCALIVYSLGIFSIIIRSTTEYLVIKL